MSDILEDDRNAPLLEEAENDAITDILNHSERIYNTFYSNLTNSNPYILDSKLELERIINWIMNASIDEKKLSYIANDRRIFHYVTNF